MPFMSFNYQQREAVLKMQSFLLSKDKFFLLKGYAGTGKSTCIQSLIQSHKKGRKWAISAPTHKAVNVLLTIGKTWKIKGLHYSTIHQLLGLKMEANSEGERALVEGKKSAIKSFDVVVLDEASMISSNLFKLIQEVAQRHRRLKFIFMGDEAQLPPVNESESPVFQQLSHSEYTVHLTEIMRQKESNPVSTIISAARECVYNPDENLALQSSYTSDKNQGAWVLERPQWLKQIERAFRSDRYQEHPDSVKVLAWTNRTVEALNFHIRSILFENSTRPYLPGERLLAKETIFDPIKGEEILLHSSTPCEVISVRKSLEENYKLWKLEILDPDGNQYQVKVLDAASVANWKADLELLRHKALEFRAAGIRSPWDDYWRHYYRYAQFSYDYAITVHRAQGSTFNNVFVAYNDIAKNPNRVERYKSLYTAFSRASDRLLIGVY